MIDHVCLSVSDSQKSKAFYEKILAPLGYEKISEFEDWVGFGRDEKPSFWIGRGTATPPFHIAFTAQNRDEVRAFFEAALDAGGKDNGGPGVRTHYHPHYYGAFILDPDGYNIEAVCHKPF